MNNINVKFLHQEYTIPEDILVYIDLLNFTDRAQHQLMDTFINRVKSAIQKGETPCLNDSDLTPEIERQVGKFISKLCDNEIFTRTINDYLQNNKGYKMISDVNKAMLDKMKALLLNKIDSWEAGFKDALYKKESSVTGMGFSILSSSFVNHAIYAAMEASTLKEQEDKASLQYQRDMDALRSRLDSQFNKEESQYITNVYIPHMESAMTIFAYELLDKYVCDLISAKKFDATTLSYINIGRSNDLLKNLDYSENKKAIIENAFIACPYNIQVYMQALKYDLLDYESFQTSKIFKQNDTIWSFLNENWGKVSFPTQFNIDYMCVKSLALFAGETPEDFLYLRTEHYADAVVKSYSRISDLLVNPDFCYKILSSSFPEAAILAGDAVSKGKAYEHVNSIISSNVWYQLTERCGHHDLLERIKKHFPEATEVTIKDHLDAYLVEQLTIKFEEARLAMVNDIHKLKEQRHIEELKQKEHERDQQIKEAARQMELNEASTKEFLIYLAIASIIIVVVLCMAFATGVKEKHSTSLEVTKNNYTASVESSTVDEVEPSAFVGVWYCSREN